MPDWMTYKGLEVPDSTTGEGGTNLKDDLKVLADRAPFLDNANPSVNDDSDAGFFAGSLWFNNDSSSQIMWVCTDATPASAKWRTLYKRVDNAIILAPAAGVGGGSDGRALQFDTGGNTRGAHAVDFQRNRTASSQVASGLASFIAGGSGNTASGAYAHAEGYGNSATGDWAHAEGAHNVSGDYTCHAEGLDNTASGVYSHAEGINTVAGDSYSHAGGLQSKAHLPGQWARAAGGFSGANGTAQSTIAQLSRRTTNATATELTFSGNTPSSASRFTIRDGQTLSCLINIVGRKENGGANDHASFLRQVCIRREGSTTQLVGSVQEIGNINPVPWPNVSITADDTNESLKIEVTGVASTAIRWMATVFASEVADAAI